MFYISMSYSMNFIDRKVYSVFDFIAEIGGLVSGIHGTFIILTAILQYQDLHYYMVSKLYKKEDLYDERTEPDPEDRGSINKKLVHTLRLNLFVFLSRLCCCLKRTKEEKFFLEGLYRFREEIDIIEFFRRSMQMKEHSKYLVSYMTQVKKNRLQRRMSKKSSD